MKIRSGIFQIKECCGTPILIGILFCNFSFSLSAKEAPQKFPVAPAVQAVSEEQIMRQFVEVWNSAEDTQHLLRRFNIDSNELKLLEKDLQNEKILKVKPPELEYLPSSHALFLRFPDSQQRILIVSESSPSQDGIKLPVMYAGFKFHQISQNGRIVDSYLRMKAALQQPLRQEGTPEGTPEGTGKKKKVSMLDLILNSVLATAQAEVISVPFTKSKKKTNWWPWIALGGIFSAFAIWKGVDYFILGNDGTKPEASIKPSDAVGEQPPGKDRKPDERVVIENGVNPGSNSKGSGPAEKQNLDNLSPIANIEMGMKSLENKEKLVLRKLSCHSSYGESLAFRKKDSQPWVDYAFSSNYKNDVFTLVQGMKEPCRFENVGANKFRSTSGVNCPKDKDKEMAFSQGDTLKNLRQSVSICCQDKKCEENLKNLVEANSEQFKNSTFVPKVDGSGIYRIKPVTPDPTDSDSQ
jgi:hypothetical protein